MAANAAYNFVILARQLASYNNLKKSYEMYMCSFEKYPQMKGRFETEFRVVLSKLNEGLATANRKAEIFGNFERAIKAFPDSADMLNDIGKYLHRYGYISEALCHFEKALNIDNSCVSIEKNLNSAKSFLFPRSQFRVLNDKIWNDAYRRAIQCYVNFNTESVIDIDAGTGLLTLFASACDPMSITACESSTTMAKLAERVVHANGAQNVVIVNQPSMILNLTDATSSVLLTDLIDSGLFGEYILQSLSHAWENLLSSDSRIIPGRAEYFIIGAKCDKLIKKYQLCDEAKVALNIPNMNVHITSYYGETYWGEDVHLYKDLQYMSEPQSLFKIDFNNYYDVHEKLYRQEPYNAELTVTKDGEINAVIGYFDLYLTEDIKVSSDPRCEERATAWQQAVFFDVLPRKVHKHDKINLPFSTHCGRLFTIPHDQPMRISPDALRCLNDTEYMNMIVGCLGTTCIYLGQITDISVVNIVDLSPFPMFGVLMLKRGANSLICYAQSSEDKTFIRTILAANNIPVHKVRIILGQCWLHGALEEKEVHVIFASILDSHGDIDVRKRKIVQHLEYTNLIKNGLILPRKYTLMGQLVYSNWLETSNRVTDEVDYKMASHVNRYQVSQTMNIDYSMLEYSALSNEFTVATNCSHIKSDVIKVPVELDGECNAILCWYTVQMVDNWGVMTTKRGNCFVEGMAFIHNLTRVFRGDEVNVLRCVDPDGSFKLIIDVEP